MSPEWTPPEDWSAITAIDARAAGEPLRVITGGLPDIPGDTIVAKRRYAQQHLDGLRRGLMWEPRGHADMYGAIITPPVTPDGDLGVLFLTQRGIQHDVRPRHHRPERTPLRSERSVPGRFHPALRQVGHRK